MDCINCGRENPNKALICYWCSLNPKTGEDPYTGLSIPTVGAVSASAVMDIPMPGVIEVPPSLAIPSAESAFAGLDQCSRFYRIHGCSSESTASPDRAG